MESKKILHPLFALTQAIIVVNFDVLIIDMNIYYILLVCLWQGLIYP